MYIYIIILAYMYMHDMHDYLRCCVSILNDLFLLFTGSCLFWDSVFK